MPNSRIYAVDPGPSLSAIVALDWRDAPLSGFPRIALAEKWTNEELLAFLWDHEDDGSILVLERMESMGMAVGEEVFETCIWTGRFIEAWDGRWDRLSRREVKLNLCGSSRAKDANVRQVLIDRWGGSAAAQRATKGTKRKPGKVAGPLGCIANDEWSALAIGVSWRDQQLAERRISRSATIQL